MKNKKEIAKYVGIFFLFTGVFYLIFDKVIPVTANNKKEEVIIEQETKEEAQTGFLVFEGPKTEKCPINGAMYTKEQRQFWEEKRPLLVMIENHSDARPQSGLNTADVVYEAVAEGGITRFMGVYYCDVSRVGDIRYDVGPVRSARTYFLDMASEYGDYPLYVHVGGANCSAPKDENGNVVGGCTSDRRTLAIEQISQYGWNNKGTWGDLSQFSLAYKVCRREPDRTGQDRATEHTMYCSTEELWNVASERGLTSTTEGSGKTWDSAFTAWKFDEAGSTASGLATEIVNLPFWKYDAYTVSWQYDSDRADYVRYNGGEKQTDFNDKQDIRAKNIIVQLVKEESNVDEHKHNIYTMTGNGKGILLQNGKRIDITWSKAKRQTRTVFKDSSGKEINFVPGKIWVEILSINSKINYEIGDKTETNSGLPNESQID